jgi:hypothetical protein
MFDRLESIRPVAATNFRRASGDDAREQHPLLDGHGLPKHLGGRSDQRGSERRSGERRRGERRSKERRSDERRGGLRTVTERRLTERRASDRRDGDRRHTDRRLQGTPRINLRKPPFLSNGWGRSRRPVVDDYA